MHKNIFIFLLSILLLIACDDLTLPSTNPSQPNPPVISNPLPASCPVGTVDYEPEGFNNYNSAVHSSIPMLKVTLSGTNARCNDGSPAVMFIRPANANYSPSGKPQEPLKASDKWVIYTQGGGSCSSAEDCLIRWCDAPGAASFESAGKMSSLGTEDAIVMNTGIFNRDSANSFSDYNHVYLFYCSSDSWIGSETQQGLVANFSSSSVTYDIEFNGEAIINSAFATLRNGPTAPDASAAEAYYDTPLPDLDEASEILLTGESAGGVGLRHHLDRLANELKQANPKVSVYGVIDASFSPVLYGANIDWSNAPYSDYNDYILNNRTPVVNDFWGVDLTALDRSCVNNANPSHSQNPDVCADPSYLLEHEITTDYFLRMDMNDPLPVPLYASPNLNPEFWGLLPNQVDYLTTLSNQLVNLPDQTPANRAGIYAPNCGNHIALIQNRFFANTITSPLEISFHDALRAWIEGKDLVVVSDRFDGINMRDAGCP